MPPVNMKDVAARAGVSVGTVSNVINRPVGGASGHPGQGRGLRSLELGVRTECLGAAAGRRAEPHHCVRRPRRRRTRSSPTWPEASRRVTRPKGLSLFVCNTDQSGARENRVSGTPHGAAGGRRPDHRRSGTPEPTAVAGSRQLGVPVVLVDRAPEHGRRLVHGRCGRCRRWPDGGGSSAWNWGTPRLAFVGGPAGVPQVADRHAGAQQAVAEAGLGDGGLLHLETAASDDRPRVERAG